VHDGPMSHIHSLNHMTISQVYQRGKTIPHWSVW